MPSAARPTTRVTRSTPKPVATASSFLVSAALVDSDGTDSEEEDNDFSFRSDEQTYSDEDEDAVIEQEEVPQWCMHLPLIFCLGCIP